MSTSRRAISAVVDFEEVDRSYCQLVDFDEEDWRTIGAGFGRRSGEGGSGNEATVRVWFGEKERID